MDAPQAVCPRRIYLEKHMKKLIAAWLIAIGMLGCGGGGDLTFRAASLVRRLGLTRISSSRLELLGAIP